MSLNVGCLTLEVCVSLNMVAPKAQQLTGGAVLVLVAVLEFVVVATEKLPAKASSASQPLIPICRAVSWQVPVEGRVATMLKVPALETNPVPTRVCEQKSRTAFPAVPRPLTMTLAPLTVNGGVNVTGAGTERGTGRLILPPVLSVLKTTKADPQLLGSTTQSKVLTGCSGIDAENQPVTLVRPVPNGTQVLEVVGLVT